MIGLVWLLELLPKNDAVLYIITLDELLNFDHIIQYYFQCGYFSGG